MDHPAVRECAVVGAPDVNRGTIVKAYIDLHEGVRGSAQLAEELQRFVKGRTSTSGGSPTEPRYTAGEQQPESAINERAALAEREDGTIRAGRLPKDFPGSAPADDVPLIQLTADEQQPIDPIAEYHALSEREDGTNIG